MRVKTRKRRKWKRQWPRISYMQMSMGLFFAELFLLLFSFILSFLKKGAAGFELSVMGLMILLMGIAGLAVTIYGHYYVKIEGRWPWMAGIISNGAICIIMLLLYLAGMQY